MKPHDAFVAVAPPVATVTLGSINEMLGFLGGTVSLAYLIWKWRREACPKKD